MNLFTQLAQQTLGELSAPIVPRLAARFEPVAPGPALDSDALAVPTGVAAASPPAGTKLWRGEPSAWGGVEPAAVEPTAWATELSEPRQMEQAHRRAEVGDPTRVTPPAEAPAPLAILRPPTLEPVVGRAEAASPPRAGAAPSGSLVMPALSTPAEAARQSTDPAPAPIIHVSIGRVEVRAVTRPPEPPRREREPPRPIGQPLEAYLRKGKREQ
jgi:hypothetical protein